MRDGDGPASDRFVTAFELAGMPAADIPGRAVLLETVAADFEQAHGRAPAWAWWVPGRIELFGKHTDYAGGRSLVAAVPRGFAVVAGPRTDRVVCTRDAHWLASMQLSLDDAGETFRGWTNYIAVVARRLAKNFPEADLGTNIVFASDLPRAAGVSSSSALVVAVALALCRRAELEKRAEWRSAIDSNLDLAGYLGAVENGLTFGALEGTSGVGTHGGSEDHTAILNCGAERVSAFSYVPVVRLGDARLPDDWRFVIMSSGIEASKAGAALGRYNRASLATRAIVDVWRRRSGRAIESLAAALAQATPGDLDSAIAGVRHPDFSPEELRRRLAHFVAEDARITPALAAVADGNLQALGELSAATQRDADDLLGNQVPETSALAALAREHGAFAASSFGAGFGGSVWAMVPARDAAAFERRWQERYLDRFAPDKPVAAFTARPAPAATELSAAFDGT